MLAVCVCVQHLLCVHLTPCDNGRIQACNHVPHGYLLCDCVSCFCRESLCLSWCQSDTDVVMLLVILLCHSENGSVYLGWEPCFGGQSCVWHFTRKHGVCVCVVCVSLSLGTYILMVCIWRSGQLGEFVLAFFVEAGSPAVSPAALWMYFTLGWPGSV